MDISSTTEAKSDQQNADDYMAGPKTVTVDRVTKGGSDQPVEIHLVEFPGKPFKPSKTCRRVLVACWGADASQYAGRRMELYRDPEVKWAGEPVGGIRISKLSHIDKAVSIALTVTRGQRKAHKIQPLAESAPTQAELNVAECDSIPDLREAWKYAGPAQKKRIEARVKELEKRAFEDDAQADMRDEAEAQDTLDKVLGVEE